jgi:microcystin-dependent protein
MKKIYFISFVLLLLTKPVLAQDGYLGEIKIWSSSVVPRGWALCNGQLLPINQNQALFSILGTTYGGDGIVNFGLPDLRGRAVVGQGGANTYGEKSGAESITLTATNLPAHNHIEPLKISSGVGTIQTPTAAATIAAPVVVVNSIARTALGFNTATPDVALAGSPTTTTGGVANPTAITTVQPFLTLNYIIAIQGIFPSQN